MSIDEGVSDELVLVDEVSCEQFDAELKKEENDKHFANKVERHQSKRNRSRSRSESRSRSKSDSQPRKSSKSSSRRHRSRSSSKSRSHRKRSRSNSPSHRRTRRSENYSRDSRPSCRRSVTDVNNNSIRESPPEKRILGVFGLPQSTTERKLRNMFREFDRLEKVQMVYDAQTGKSRGFAFIYFDSVLAAKKAKEKFNGYCLYGNTIRVDYSVTDKPHQPTPGVYMGKNVRPDHRSLRGHRPFVDYGRRPRPFFHSFRTHANERSRRWSTSRSRSPRR